MTCLEEMGAFAFLDSLLDELQSLLHVLRVNGILYLVVAAYKNRVISGAHLEDMLDSSWVTSDPQD